MNNKYRFVILFVVAIFLFLYGGATTYLEGENKLWQDKDLFLEDFVTKSIDTIIELENTNLETKWKESIDLKNALPANSDNKEEITFVSQLPLFEDSIKDEDVLFLKYKSFKVGGIERNLDVSYADMQNVINEALTYKGTQHLMGGLSHSGIDCSGLLYISFYSCGITNCPRTAQEFARYGEIILNINEIQAGDLVFFAGTYSTSRLVTHAGICIGNGEFIHTSADNGVIISKINDPFYWRKKFLYATRVINK